MSEIRGESRKHIPPFRQGGACYTQIHSNKCQDCFGKPKRHVRSKSNSPHRPQNEWTLCNRYQILTAADCVSGHEGIKKRHRTYISDEPDAIHVLEDKTKYRIMFHSWGFGFFYQWGSPSRVIRLYGRGLNKSAGAERQGADVGISLKIRLKTHEMNES